MLFFTNYYFKIWVYLKIALNLNFLLFYPEPKGHRLIINVILMVELTVKTLRF